MSSLWRLFGALNVIVTDTDPKFFVPWPAACKDFFAALNACVKSPLGDIPLKEDVVDFEVFMVEQGQGFSLVKLE